MPCKPPSPPARGSVTPPTLPLSLQISSPHVLLPPLKKFGMRERCYPLTMDATPNRHQLALLALPSP